MSGRASDQSPTTVREHMFRRPSRSARAAGDVRESHGGRRLATGITISAAFVIAAHLLHAVGGRARIFSSPGSGTTVMLEVPKP